MTLPELEPLYTEVEAAKKLGIEFKWLRAERYAGRIGWKKVAGRVMYRLSDLVDWQKRGIPPCQEADPPKNRDSSSSKGRTKAIGATESSDASLQRALAVADRLIKASRARSSTTESGSDAVQRVIANADRRIKSSRAGSSTGGVKPKEGFQGHIIPMKSR